MTQHGAEDADNNEWPGSDHEARRFIAARIPGCTSVDAPAIDTERYGQGSEPATLVEPKVIEGAAFRAIPIANRDGRAHSGFTGFLDGTQNIGIVNLVDGIPVVWGTVAAAIRLRVNRRLVSWLRTMPALERRYYVPFRYLRDLDARMQSDSRVVDTAVADARGEFPSRHPAASWLDRCRGAWRRSAAG